MNFPKQRGIPSSPHTPRGCNYYSPLEITKAKQILTTNQCVPYSKPNVPLFLSGRVRQYSWICPLLLFLTQLSCFAFLTQSDSSTFRTTFRCWTPLLSLCVGVIFSSYGWVLSTQPALEEEMQASHFVLQAWLPSGIQRGGNCLENNTEWLEMRITEPLLCKWERVHWGRSWGRKQECQRSVLHTWLAD